MQIRSRLVARDFRSGTRPDMYAGTLPMNALKEVLSILANPRNEFSVFHIDVSRAHFHAKAQRFVLVRLPSEDMGKIDAGKSDR